ncbi:MAG: arginine--tRNA ligase [Candidatus Cloacimonadales bacterium]
MKKKIRKDIERGMRRLKLKCNKDFTVEIPKNESHGDFSTNVALISAGLNKLKPVTIANRLIKQLSSKEYYRSISKAGPGFINFHLDNSVYYEELQNIHKEKADYGSSEFGKKELVILEYVSANPTGPLNIVSARSAAYGNTLHRIMQFVGYKPFSEFYINDAGNQVDILAESLELRYREHHGEDIGEFPHEAYHGEYLKELAAQLALAEGRKLFHLGEKDRLERMKNFALAAMHKEHLRSLERYGVDFDNWMSERRLRDEGVLEEALSYLAEAHVTYEQDDAVWFASTKFGDEKDRVLIKSDGNPTYLVPDIAYHITKFHRGFAHIIDVLGPDHHGYVPRLIAALQALELPQDRLEIIYLQHINLLENGEVVKMSKRAGKIVTLDDLLDEVGRDAARYFFIERKPSSHLNFDLDLAKSKSQENPVYYIQYAHVRINSILKKARKDKFSVKKFDKTKLHLLQTEEEISMIKKMMSLQDTLENIAETREPHRLANYTYELAGLFHKYYSNNKIIDKKQPELTQCRLYLLWAVKCVIANCLDLMGISAPEKM